MTKIRIRAMNGWQLDSHDGGLAYELIHPDGQSIFLQGDDATQFYSNLEAYEDKNPHMYVSTILANLWRNYQ